jgi:hypothetical protein
MSDWPVRRLAIRLGRVRLHRLRLRCEHGDWVVLKRRRAWSALLIAPGNLYLWAIGAGVSVLSRRRWQERERVIYETVYQAPCRVEAGGWLVLPRWSGRVVAGFAADVREPGEDRLCALGAAARALEAFHTVVVAGTRLSHGDATVHNVMYDPDRGQARWFDFDMAHEDQLAEVVRHADDLRALCYSAIESARGLEVIDIVATLVKAYGRREVWRHLQARLRSGPIHASVFHRAQADPGRSRREAFEQAILKQQFDDEPIR